MARLLDALDVEQKEALAADKRDVRVPRLSGAVDDAAHDGHVRTLHLRTFAVEPLQRLLDAKRRPDDVRLRPPASRTRGDVRTGRAQPEAAQQLLPRRGGGRVAACELMVVSPAIRNLIREGKTPQIANAVATSADLGGITMDNALVRLFKDKQITAETARAAAHDPDYVKKNTLF